MMAIRSHFAPDVINGIEVGDTVYWHVTNVEQDWDILHGFAVLGMNTAELIMQPGETRTIKWVPTQPGVYPFYCTDFCSALHQEMSGYVRVGARGSNTPITFAVSDRAATQQDRAGRYLNPSSTVHEHPKGEGR
jgi:nitrous-oxide reductase